MDTVGGQTLADIRRETEQSRAALTSTVQELKVKVTDTADEWRQRLSPDAIKTDVKEYVSSRSTEFTASVVQSAKDNPLQALAIASSIAIPALKLARSIPVPILMIGAGLFLSNSKKGRELSAQAQEAMSDAASAATRKMHDLQGSIGETVDASLSTIDAAKSSISDGVQSLTSHASDLKDKAFGAAETVQDRLAEAKESALPNAADAKAAAQTFSSSIQNNAWLVAGVGLAIGGLIASVLPKSDTEQSLLGEASAKLKDKAQTVVTDAVDTARNAAVSAFDDLAERAELQGLSPAGLADAASDVGDRLREVAEAASTSAIVQSNEIHSRQETQR